MTMLKQIFLLQNISLFSCSFFIPSPTKYVIDIFPSCCCCCCCPSLFVVVVDPCWLFGGTMVCSPLFLLLLSLSVGWWYDGLLSCFSFFVLNSSKQIQSFTVSLSLACADSQLTGEKNPTNGTSGLRNIIIAIVVVDINIIPSTIIVITMKTSTGGRSGKPFYTERLFAGIVWQRWRGLLSPS